MNRYEHITGDILEDLGFELITSEISNDNFDMSFEIGYRHPNLDPFNLILVDYKNGCWHFSQRKWAMNGIGKMKSIDDLIIGFRFVTGLNVITLKPDNP